MVEYEGFGICIVINATEHFLTIQNKDGNFNAIANPERAKPIPHPDTARLNWLEKKMLEDSDQTIVCDGYNGFCTLGNFREHRQPIFENIREAIDHEMKKQGE